jgi:Peptidase S46
LPGTRCNFAEFDGGLSFSITAFIELSDVRLVYAPPVGVGDYGGEIDNWSWPRHTGDFSLVRVYKEGKPYQPRDFFPVSTEGVKGYGAVAVLGYPGRSYRALTAAEMEERQQRFFPALRDFAGEAVAILQDEARQSKEAELATSDEVRWLLNAKKNAEGQLAGLARGRIVEKRREQDARVQAWLAAHPEHPAAREAALAAAGLAQLAADKQAAWDHDFLLDRILPLGIDWALTLARRAHEAQKPDAEREPGWQERDLPRLRERFERDQKHFNARVDERLLRAWIRRTQALAPGQRLAAIDALFAGVADPALVARKISALYSASKLFELPVRMAMFAETTQQLEARHDPLIDLGLALDAERRALKQKRDTWAGAVLRLRPSWRKAVIAEAGRVLAPDANSTLRVSFGKVQGYSPRDAVAFAPQTTLSGALEKHTGVFPFDLPQRVREARASGRFVDAGLGDVPIDFLADCDTTGGNSGSAVIDAKGRLVGVNFDRVWENVANDFGYDPEVARNVVADVRYLLWMLEEVEKAPALVAELTAAQ